MAESIVFVILSLGIILLGAELFTNGIEWFGRKLRLAEGAVGSVLAAVGTALPETMIPIIAIVFSRGHARDEIGIGAILGAPLMLSTLAFFVTGLAVFVFTGLGRRTTHMMVDPQVFGRDLRTFFLVYVLAVGASFLPGRPYKVVVAVVLVGLYVRYVRQTFRHVTAPGHERELGPLHFHRAAEVPKLRIIVSQVLGALALIVGGAHLFVEHLSRIALATGASELVLAMIIAPIATELPEKFNSVTWIRQRKDTLALGNISGAMVFQSSILPAIGLLFTPWVLTEKGLASAVIALTASGFVWAAMAWQKRLRPHILVFGIVLYVAYPLYIFVLRG